MRRLTTRQPLANYGKPYPCAIIHWEADEDQLGYDGEMVCWNENEKIGQRHFLSIRQSMPLGAITITFDGSSHGARAYAGFEGTRLDERDLQWATAWAISVLRRIENEVIQ